MKNLIGETFGMWEVIDYAPKQKTNIAWKCKCQCGNVKNVLEYNLISGKSTNCGCVRFKKFKDMAITHGLSKSRLYRLYKGMKSRCYNANNEAYKHYGGRGIKICDEWLNDFVTFYNWSLNNGYTETSTIDRIDTNGDYEPNNCRWTGYKVQQNNRRNNLCITINEVEKTASEWADEKNICKPTLYSQIYRLLNQLGIDPSFAKISIKIERNDIYKDE